MSTDEVKRSAGDWATIAIAGTLYETQTQVMDVLDKGDGGKAKVVEGSDPNGKKYTFVIIKGYQP